MLSDFGVGAGSVRVLGRAIVTGMPVFLKVLSFVGMIAMLWVGGGMVLGGVLAGLPFQERERVEKGYLLAQLRADDLIAEIAAAVLPHRGEGKVADYIPALAAVDPMKFGLAIALGVNNGLMKARYLA